jgi:hypothetical protein
MNEPTQTPAAIVEALKRELAAVLDQLPSDAASALHYEPFAGEETR